VQVKRAAAQTTAQGDGAPRSHARSGTLRGSLRSRAEVRFSAQSTGASGKLDHYRSGSGAGGRERAPTGAQGRHP